MNNKKLLLVLPVLALVVSFGISGNTANAFTRISSQIGPGARGTQVTNLQTFLASNFSVYPEGLITGFYGPMTANAVSQFQIGYGMSPVGNVGPRTLLTLDNLIDLGKSIDVNSAVISNVRSAVAGRTAYISWNNSELVRSKIFYSTNYIQMTEGTQAKTEVAITGSMVNDTAFGTVKSIALTDLQPTTVYYYVIEVIDEAGNVSVTLPNTFTTGY